MLKALRELDNEQQVALLFVLVFGGLLLVSVAALLASLRERPPESTPGRSQGDSPPWGADTSETTFPGGAPGRHTRYQRYQRFVRDLRAVWIGAVVFWLAWISGPLGATLLFGVFSFLALREFITLSPTRRADHRGLILAFFAVLPLQYVLVGHRNFDLFSVFIPVYVFFAIPVVSALAGDPERFLERNAGIQWGIMVCVYGLSHAPALLLLNFPGAAPGRGAFLVFFLVIVTAIAQIVQEAASRWWRHRPLARQISRSFSARAWALGTLAGALAGALLFWITPFKLPQAFAMALIAGGTGTLGEFVMKALKKDAGVAYWGNQAAVTGAVGLLDRVAPLAFAAPVFFHSVRWYFRLTP